ncbi:hypothetical protein [Pseudomonas hunanensis]|uniref:hypothetical protein n=1 Tax=Pseudomonas hunanensis TaxID=1247546 RepID=UPI0030DC915C
MAFWEFHGDSHAQALIIDADGIVCFSPLDMDNIKEAVRKVYGVQTISSTTGRPLVQPEPPNQPTVCETHPTYEEALRAAAGLIEKGCEVVVTAPGKGLPIRGAYVATTLPPCSTKGFCSDPRRS